MTNQNPQPELFSTAFTIVNAALATQSAAPTIIRPHHAANEVVRIYAIQVAFIDTAGAPIHDIDLQLSIGGSFIPLGGTNNGWFDAVVIAGKDDKMLKFPCPILGLFGQEIGLSWRNNHAVADGTFTLKVTLIAEIALSEEPCVQCNSDNPSPRQA